MAGVPPKLKAIAHYVKIANEYSQRDPAIYYWCLLSGVQRGMQIDKTSPECKQFLTQNLSLLELIKKQNIGNEAISNELVANAHVEEVALNLFAFADTEDRAGRFNKNVVKAFYTAGYLFDVLSVFGEVDGQIQQQQKYAKWKAAYIHNCLKNGEPPVPGPVGGDGGEYGIGDEYGDPGLGGPSFGMGGATGGMGGGGGGGGSTFSMPPAPSIGFVQPPTPAAAPSPSPSTVSAPAAVVPSVPNTSGLQTSDFMKAQKFCKYAVSSLEYEDAQSAISNLKQALDILQKPKN